MRMRVTWAVIGVVAALASLAGTAGAQIFTPGYLPPRGGPEMGVYLNDHPGGFSVELLWRRGFGDYDLGLRGGVASFGDAALLAGAEYRRLLDLGTEPLDLAATGGVQVVLGDGSAFGAGAGVTLGHTFVPEGFTFTPYLHPRIGLVAGGGHSDLEVLADLGFDFAFRRDLVLRFGIGLGDPTANWGIGLSWR